MSQINLTAKDDYIISPQILVVLLHDADLEEDDKTLINKINTLMRTIGEGDMGVLGFLFDGQLFEKWDQFELMRPYYKGILVNSLIPFEIINWPEEYYDLFIDMLLDKG